MISVGSPSEILGVRIPEMTTNNFSIPFFSFVYCRMGFLILGRWVGRKKKKKTQK